MADPEYGLNQDIINDQESREKQQVDLAVDKGTTPTKRDKMGNIVLYEDPLNEGNQIDSPDQWISVNLRRPNYDDDEVKNVMKFDVNELYKKSRLNEESRLRQQIEELRRQLKEASANIVIRRVAREGDPREIEPGVIPSIENTIKLPDRTTGEFSSTPLEFLVNTAIFNDETREITELGGPNPITVNYYIVKNEDGSDFAYGYGTRETLFTQRRLQDDTLINLDESYDVVVDLEDFNKFSNFYGWYYKNSSNGNILYEKINNNKAIRFNLIKKRNTGVNSIDDSRNTYEILAVFGNESPLEKNTIVSDITLNVGVVERNYPYRFNTGIFPDVFIINYFDRTGEIIDTEKQSNPHNMDINTSIRKLMSIIFNPSALDIKPSPVRFSGWFRQLQSGVWEKVSNELTIYIGNRSIAPPGSICINFSDNLTLVAGYTFGDDDSKKGRGGNGDNPDDYSQNGSSNNNDLGDNGSDFGDDNMLNRKIKIVP